MAGEQGAAVDGEDKGVYVEYLGDIASIALDDVRAASKRMEAHHELNKDSFDDIVCDANIINRLVNDTMDRIEEFEKTLREHFGIVGIQGLCMAIQP